MTEDRRGREGEEGRWKVEGGNVERWRGKGPFIDEEEENQKPTITLLAVCAGFKP